MLCDFINAICTRYTVSEQFHLISNFQVTFASKSKEKNENDICIKKILYIKHQILMNVMHSDILLYPQWRCTLLLYSHFQNRDKIMTIKHKNAPEKSLCSSKIGFNANYHFLFFLLILGWNMIQFLTGFVRFTQTYIKCHFCPVDLLWVF